MKNKIISFALTLILFIGISSISCTTFAKPLSITTKNNNLFY